MKYLFLDESGDLGFNPKKKNSKYFVITILFASDKKPLENIVKKIHKNLRKNVKKLSGGVLHAVKEKPITRKRLLRLLVDKEVAIMTIFLNKSKVYTHLQDEKHVLYNYVTNILLDRIMTKHLDKDKEIILIAAKRETNKFLNAGFKDYLENQLKNKHKALITIEIKMPSEEKALQAVDFASWSIFRKYEHGDDSYYKLIKKIIVEESPLFP
ncbi:MAG: DUF3800 domain-containing protein [Patescibacteria group bacterium]